MNARNDHPESRIVTRLRRLRRTMRRRLALFGFCAVVTGGVLTLLTYILLDWLLRFPPEIRVLLGAVFVVGGAGAVAHWVVRPLRVRIGVEELAGRLERHFTHLNDRLTSTVLFLRELGDGSPALRRQVIANTEVVVRDLPLGEILSLRPLIRVTLFAILSVVTLVIVVVGHPTWARMGAQRFLTPYSPLRWPRTVDIEPRTGDQKVAFGESTIVEMGVIRSGKATLRGVLRLRHADGDLTALAMRRGDDNTYTCNIDNLTETLTYWFEAGDDSTADQPSTLTMVHRPAVIGATGRVHPPAYASARPATEVELSTGVVHATRGGRLELELETDRPVRAGDGASLMTPGEDIPPLRVMNSASTRWHGIVEIDDDTELTVRLVDDDGFTNRGGPMYTIVTAPDREPTVTIIEPRSTVEVTPLATVRLQARAEDDLGIADLALVGQASPGESAFTLPLLASWTPDLEKTDRVAGTVDYAWNIAAQAAKPGDTLVYRVRATDNFASSDGPGQTGYSPSLRLTIISRESFEQRRQDEMALIEGRIRRALLDQRLAIDESQSLARAVEIEGETTRRREALSAASRGQSRLADDVTKLARRLDQVVERMDANGLGDDASRGHIRGLSQSLDEAAAGPMDSAARHLEAARAADADATAATTSIAAGAAQQTIAAESLQTVLQNMGRWGDFQQILTKTRDLLDRQEAVRAATLGQRDKTLGRPFASLDETDQTVVRANARAQTLLAEETTQLLDQMRQLVARAAATHVDASADGSAAGNAGIDPATTAALEESLRAAVAAEIVRDMREASDAIAANRTSAAQIGQRAAETGLADMLAALRERRTRELEQLAKSIENARDTVTYLRTQQTELRTATDEGQRLAAEPAVWTQLGQRQHALRNNAAGLTDDWRRREQLAALAGTLEQCVPPMGEAAEALVRADGSTAVEPQRQAIAHLNAVLAELDRLADETRHQAEKQKLAATRAKLEALRNRQQDINDKTAEVMAAGDDGGRRRRAETRKVSILAGEQDHLHEETVQLRTELGQAVVYDFVLGRIVDWMSASADALAARRLDPSLTHHQRRIVSELDLLIAAIADISKLPSPDEFARGAGRKSGGQAAGQEQPVLVPTLAELLVLKAMQTALNAETVRAATDYDADTATEAKLLEVRGLAAEQEQIAALTQKVIQKAQERDDAKP